MKKLIVFLLGILLAGFAARATAGQPLAELPLERLAPHALALAASPATTTCTHPCIAFSFTASTSSAAQGYNFYFGTASGGESATPVNSALLTSLCSGTSCSAIITAPSGTGGNATSSLIAPNATVYATLEACATSASTGSLVCSAASNEVKCIIPLLTTDIAAPTSLAGTPN